MAVVQLASAMYDYGYIGYGYVGSVMDQAHSILDLSSIIYAALLLLAIYIVTLVCYKVYVFLFHVYEYKPQRSHLQGRQPNKMYGRVKWKDGKTTGAELPPMVPNGWYYIMTSDQLKKEQVKHVSMCGLELAVFRDVNGEVHALDAFCPHLGANMGVGGKVKGTCLECPFHAWKFNGEDGKCTDIPGAKKIPDIARTKSWPILERNLMLFLWFDAEERDPLYLPRQLDEIYQQNWVVHGVGEHIVHCHISEIPENGADIGHFLPVHSSNIVYGSDLERINTSERSLMEHGWSEPTWRASEDEWYLALGTLRHDLMIKGYKVPLTKADTVFEQIGPGIVYLKPTLVTGTALLIMCVIPIETFKQKLIHVAMGPRGLLGRLNALGTLLSEGFMVERDMVIWNNKIFNKQSVFAATPSDELLVKFRRWFSQFYSENSKATSSKTDLSW